MQLSQTLLGNELKFRISGNLDARTYREARQRFEQALATKPAAVVVDLSGLRLIDSSGVGAIVSLFKGVQGAGAAFHLEGVTGQPLSIFKVLRLDKVFEVP